MDLVLMLDIILMIIILILMMKMILMVIFIDVGHDEEINLAVRTEHALA